MVVSGIIASAHVGVIQMTRLNSQMSKQEGEKTTWDSLGMVGLI
jgi:hypothetical protein